MAGPLDLRGRVVISDGATAVLNSIKSSLQSVGEATRRISSGQFAANLAKSTEKGVRRLTADASRFSGAATGVGLGLTGIIAATKDFNESKFGYGFARITDYLKDGRLDLVGWKKDMDETAATARKAAIAFGTTANVTMKAREEVEKLGFKGAESNALFNAAVGLHLSEPSALAAGEAAKYMGSIYRAYEQQRRKLAAKMGKDANEPGFIEAYIKGIAGKTAVAGADSALGPADIVEGMRQYAPQWAAMGVDLDFALAALAHGSNYGFRAPELGTAYKSMINKILNPTAAGLGILNNLKIDRQEFFKAGAVEPGKAATTLNSLLSGSLYQGKGGQKNKAAIRALLDEGYKSGTVSSPEFQEKLFGRVSKMLGPAWAGRAQEIHQAVANSTLNPAGDIDLPRYLKALRDAGASVSQIATIFEGRHISRNMPIFQFYEKLIETYDKLKGVDGAVMDAVVQGRKNTEAGSLDALMGAWQELILAMQDTGVIETAKNALQGLAEALRALPPDVVKWGTGLTIVAGGLAALGVAVGAIMPLARLAIGLAGAGLTGAGAVAGVAGTAALARMGLGASVVGAPILTSGAAAAGVGTAGATAGILSRMGMRFIPGLGLVAMAGLGGYDAYQEYKKSGSLWESSKAFLGGATGYNALKEFFFGSPAKAETPQSFPQSTPGAATVPLQSTPGATNAPAQTISGAQTAADQLRSVFAAIDLAGEGRRIMESLASGIRAGGASAIAAANEVAAGIRASTSNTVPLNTGPAMRSAK